MLLQTEGLEVMMKQDSTSNCLSEDAKSADVCRDGLQFQPHCNVAEIVLFNLKLSIRNRRPNASAIQQCLRFQSLCFVTEIVLFTSWNTLGRRVTISKVLFATFCYENSTQPWEVLRRRLSAQEFEVYE